MMYVKNLPHYRDSTDHSHFYYYCQIWWAHLVKIVYLPARNLGLFRSMDNQTQTAYLNKVINLTDLCLLFIFSNSQKVLTSCKQEIWGTSRSL